ncbi:hypothetical protein XELAEV_18016202mg [Xenopus laevis]|uniref:2-oxo-4-hydroxy-4-carboxy-5-ureidoimidazoline decarboxylase n=1 Tax=Xenopus laevis TaxID=8355 RepID=A0A974HWM9_XENLA|nr:hypothetical protein XELAEV_18016202mg [Xenopus laevis]
MDLNIINAMSYEEFLDIFGNIIERCPLVTAAIWSQRPFASVTELENSVYGFIDSLPPTAGLASLSPKERDTLNLLNSQYKAKFGFRFVICAKMSDKNKIMQELGSRLQSEQLEELQIGIAEVKKICHLRIIDLFLHLKSPTKL